MSPGDDKLTTYVLKYTPPRPGLFMLDVRIWGKHILGSPFTVQVSAAPLECPLPFHSSLRTNSCLNFERGREGNSGDAVASISAQRECRAKQHGLAWGPSASA